VNSALPHQTQAYESQQRGIAVLNQYVRTEKTDSLSIEIQCMIDPYLQSPTSAFSVSLSLSLFVFPLNMLSCFLWFGWQLMGFVLVIEGASGGEFDSCEVQQFFWAGKFVSLHTNPTLACSTLKQCQCPFYATQCSLFACYVKTTIEKKEANFFLLSSSLDMIIQTWRGIRSRPVLSLMIYVCLNHEA
jgi:hypothetical protein